MTKTETPQELPPVPCPGPDCDRDLLRDNRGAAPGHITDCIETSEPGVGVFVCGTCGTCSEWAFTEHPATAAYRRVVDPPRRGYLFAGSAD
jgi:hypothetical protein